MTASTSTMHQRKVAVFNPLETLNQSVVERAVIGNVGKTLDISQQR